VIALVNTNVVLDVLTRREPFFADSALVLAAIEKSVCKGALCATTVTTLHYLIGSKLAPVESLEKVKGLLSLFEVAPINRAVLESALSSGLSDFEDGVLHEAARQYGADCVVTRNLKDFKRATLPVYSPAQFLELLEGKDSG